MKVARRTMISRQRAEKGTSRRKAEKEGMFRTGFLKAPAGQY